MKHRYRPVSAKIIQVAPLCFTSLLKIEVTDVFTAKRRWSLPKLVAQSQGSICDISDDSDSVGFWRRRELDAEMTPAALLEDIYSQGSDFSSRS